MGLILGVVTQTVEELGAKKIGKSSIFMLFEQYLSLIVNVYHKVDYHDSKFLDLF